MELVQLIRELFPTMYWSAGFIACCVVVMILSAVLYIVTRWPAWVFTFVAAVIYCVPFFMYQY